MSNRTTEQEDKSRIQRERERVKNKYVFLLFEIKNQN